MMESTRFMIETLVFIHFKELNLLKFTAFKNVCWMGGEWRRKCGTVHFFVNLVIVDLVYKRSIKCFLCLLSPYYIALSYLKAHILNFYQWFRLIMYHFNERVWTVTNLSLSDGSLKSYHHNVLQVLFERALPVAVSPCASNPK